MHLKTDANICIFKGILQSKTFLKTLVFSYFRTMLDLLVFFRALDDNIQLKDKHVLVIGSETPWLEAILLAKGAKKVTTLGKLVTLILPKKRNRIPAKNLNFKASKLLLLTFKIPCEPL